MKFRATAKLAILWMVIMSPVASEATGLLESVKVNCKLVVGWLAPSPVRTRRFSYEVSRYRGYDKSGFSLDLTSASTLEIEQLNEIFSSNDPWHLARAVLNVVTVSEHLSTAEKIEIWRAVVQKNKAIAESWQSTEMQVKAIDQNSIAAQKFGEIAALFWGGHNVVAFTKDGKVLRGNMEMVNDPLTKQSIVTDRVDYDSLQLRKPK